MKKVKCFALFKEGKGYYYMGYDGIDGYDGYSRRIIKGTILFEDKLSFKKFKQFEEDTSDESVYSLGSLKKIWLSKKKAKRLLRNSYVTE